MVSRHAQPIGIKSVSRQTSDASTIDVDCLAFGVGYQYAKPIFEVVPRQALQAYLLNIFKAIRIQAGVIFKDIRAKARLTKTLRREELVAPHTFAGIELQHISTLAF